MMHSYKAWLFMEHRTVSYELAGHDNKIADAVENEFRTGTPGFKWHFRWAREGMRGPGGWIDAPEPSTRAAVILSAVGCSLGGGL